MKTAVCNPKVARALADIETAKTGQPPEVVEFWDFIADAIKRCGDPGAVFDQVLDLIARDRAKATS